MKLSIYTLVSYNFLKKISIITKPTGFLIALLLFSTITFSQTTQKSIRKLQKETEAIVSLNNEGTAEFIKFPKNKALQLKGSTAYNKSLSFLKENAAVYKIESPEESLLLDKIETDNYGLQHVILKQHYKGIPVYDAQLRFHFNSKVRLSSINGNYISNISLNPIPSLTKNEANTIALNLVTNQNLNDSGKALKINKNTLYLFQKGLAQGYSGAKYLVYEIEVRNDADVREFIFVDAHKGVIVEQFTGLPHALDRKLYESNSGALIWQEGDPFPAALDQWQQNEIEAAGHTYNFFKNAFGYVSYDNSDTPMTTINNPSNGRCPNAYWNGTTANFCIGTAADDVVAHEWGHAYTEYTSGLIYQWQSGAINESFSDIWGETIDLLNGYEDADENNGIRTSCNNSNRWMIGEDASVFGGAIRDLWYPICKSDPGKVSDNQYHCGSGDRGGVHTNSGIPNHLYALLVDGNTYDWQKINSIGMVKAAHIFWRAQSIYLTPTSDFKNLADALEAAATDLIGFNLEGLSTASPAGPSGEIITVSDVAEVTKAILAVQLRMDPNCYFTTLLATPDLDLCAVGTSDHSIWIEDWESGTAAWTISQLPVNPDTWDFREWTLESTLPDNRVGKGIFGVDEINSGDCVTDLDNGIIRLQSPVISIPTVTTPGNIRMAFNHYVAMEDSWDGGNIKYNINGSGWTLLPNSAFLYNGYNKPLNTITDEGVNDNPMAGENSFSGSDGGSISGSWGQSLINLSDIGNGVEVNPGDGIEFRWELGTDGCNGLIGWYIDEIYVFSCNTNLSVNDIDNDTFLIYPNPNYGTFTIKTNSLTENDIDVFIFDITGREVFKKCYTNTNRLDEEIILNSVQRGVYLIKINSGKQTEIKKIIIQ